jgi:hypothetical protein
MTGIKGTGNFNHHGTPGVLNICTQYPLLVLIVVITKVKIAHTIVTAMLPVTLAPPGNMGTSPSVLFIQIKKNTVNKNGMYLT